MTFRLQARFALVLAVVLLATGCSIRAQPAQAPARRLAGEAALAAATAPTAPTAPAARTRCRASRDRGSRRARLPK